MIALSLNNQVHAVRSAKKMLAMAWWNPPARAWPGGGRRRPTAYPVLLKVFYYCLDSAALCMPLFFSMRSLAFC
jgi:hypothetical protein